MTPRGLAVRLRKLLLLAFMLAASAPAVAFMFLGESAALRRERDAAQDKHLTMARHLAATAEALVRVRIEFVRRYAELERARPKTGADAPGALALGFRHLCLVDVKSGAILAETKLVDADVMSPAFVRQAVREAAATPSVSPGRLDASGAPVLFVVTPLPDGLAAVGALDPKFVSDLGIAVAFGKRGHAVIVDQAGQALAHPLPEWRREMRNLSKIKPVALILKQQEGVIEFNSPATEEGMIAGYATSPSLGWGTLVVQPVEELRASAGSFFMTMLTVVAPLSLLAAAVGAALTARMIARPIERVADAARRFEAGDHAARAPESERWTIEETTVLGERFNAMAGAVGQHEDALQSSLERAEVASRAKTIFLANMSHELRTPLNAVIGFAEVISTELMGPIRNRRYLEYADDIGRSARHLLALINDVLDLSTAEADRLSIEVGPTAVGSVMGLAARQIASQADAHGVRVISEPLRPDIVIAADERRLLQILLNLLSNAVRFTPPGGEVRLSAERLDTRLRIVVADTGIGMSKEQAALALQPFGQPHVAEDPEDRGSGLGLPLARKLALLHGGALSVDCTPGEGCRVFVDLPITGPGIDAGVHARRSARAA